MVNNCSWYHVEKNQLPTLQLQTPHTYYGNQKFLKLGHLDSHYQTEPLTPHTSKELPWWQQQGARKHPQILLQQSKTCVTAYTTCRLRETLELLSAFRSTAPAPSGTSTQQQLVTAVTRIDQESESMTRSLAQDLNGNAANANKWRAH